MKKLLTELRTLLPGVRFEPGEDFRWSPANTTLTYRPEQTETGLWSLLHEASHALLGHTGYRYDTELLFLEVDAWKKSEELGRRFAVIIDTEHIQDCLDTYRDWLHQRSTCPRCSVVSLQIAPQEYMCHNCTATWQVSASRFCRAYRLSAPSTKKSPRLVEATFH